MKFAPTKKNKKVKIQSTAIVTTGKNTLYYVDGTLVRVAANK